MPLGRRGEGIAARYLRRCGYRILERNFRAAGAEIDLVAADRETLVFVEVKARSSGALGTPAEAVDARKPSASAAPPESTCGAIARKHGRRASMSSR